VPAYSALDRLLHRLALQLAPVAEMSFDMDQQRVGPMAPDLCEARHVYVAGLARAGTTVLMRRFHASGAFRSLTYRDMPFVLAPNLWKSLSATSKRKLKAAERAHGDGVRVDADSPESLEEVFWRVFDGRRYITQDQLHAHAPDTSLRESYQRYVGAILASGAAGQTRYLSKNNNNILRLDTISRAFPNALILVPFRRPIDHARSLLRQHLHFREVHAGDRFARHYMTWLVHHEFGADHRPFRLGMDGKAPLPEDTTCLDYWLELWLRTYRWLLETAPETVVFVGYEDLCSDPAVWQRLAALAGIDGGVSPDGGFRASKPRPAGALDGERLAEAEELYGALNSRARACLFQEGLAADYEAVTCSADAAKFDKCDRSDLVQTPGNAIADVLKN
jgi:hypothetical protein